MTPIVITLDVELAKLDSIGRVLDCQPGDILAHRPPVEDETNESA